MSNPTSEEFGRLFPGQREEAQRQGIHPDFVDSFVPLGAGRAPFTKAQREALFPSDRRVAVLSDIVKTAHVPDLGPSCPHCLNLLVDCLCGELERAS